ncbi:RNA polymerase sigma factor [Flavitalea flava]
MNLPTDQDEFLQMIRDNQRILFKICNSYCRNKNDREDLAQEIIYQLWKSGGHYNSDQRFSTWMYRIALNVAISFYRKEKKEGAKESFGEGSNLPPHLLIDIGNETEDTSEIEDRSRRLQQYIRELNELDKALMILYLEENSYKEISGIMGITETNVATRISRIKVILKQKFSQ